MAYADEVLADSPWGYWKCTELSGLPQDSSGNARHVTSVGWRFDGSAPTYGQPPVLLSEPTDTSIKMNLSFFRFPGLDLAGIDFTLECWVKIARLDDGLKLFQQLAFYFTDWVVDVALTASGEIELDFGNITLTTAALLTVGDFAHIVIRRDQTADLSSIWLDGVKVAESSIGPKVATNTDFGFAWSNNAGCSQYVGHLAVYLSALADARILAHFNAGTGEEPVEWSVAAASSTEAAFSVQQDTAILEVEYQVTTAADTGFATPVYTATDAGATRYLHTATGLTASTAYLGRIRVRTSDGWQPYQTAQSFTTLAAPAPVSPFVSAMDRWIAPTYGEFISGAAYTLSIQAVGAPANWYVSDDWGANWTQLASLSTASTLAFDTTAYTDGDRLVFWLEVPSTGENAFQEATVDNGSLIDIACGLPTERFWGTGNLLHAGNYTYGYGPVAQSPLTAACFGSAALDDADEVEVSVLVGDSWASGGAWWQQQYSALGWMAGAAIGVSGHDADGDSTGLFVGYRIQQVMPCARNGGFALGYPYDGSSTAGVLVYGFANGVPEVDATNIAQSNLYTRTRLPAACDVAFFRGLFVRLTKPDRIGAPNEVRLQIKASFGGSIAGVASNPYDGSYDVDTVLDLGYPFACGRTGVAIGKVLSAIAGQGALATTSLCVRALATSTCSTAPSGVPIPTVIPTDDTVVCDEVTLDITPPGGTYGPGHSTTRWEIASSSDPYYSSPVVDTGFQSADLLTYTATLPPGDYIWRATIVVDGSQVGPSADDTFTIDANSPPTAPIWVKPFAGQVFSTPSTITLNLAAATDPDSDPLTYEVYYSPDDGATLVEIFPLGSIDPDTDTPWDVSGVPAGELVLYVRAFDGCEYGPFDTVCIEIIAAGCPKDTIHVTWARRVEVWSDVEGNGGVRQAFVPEFIDMSDHVELGGEERAELLFPRASSAIATAKVWTYLRARKVLRVHWSDLTYTETRVARLTDSRGELNALLTRLELDAIWYDLTTRILKRVEANGAVYHDFPLVLTPAEHIAFMLGQSPRHFVAGKNHAATDPVKIEYSWETPLSALLNLADVTRMELDFPRACDLYRIDLVTAVGADSTLACSFTADVSGMAVTFTDTSTPADEVVEWLWDFGDGSSGSTEQNPTHIYASSGPFTVTLTVTDLDGNMCTATGTVSFSASASPSASPSPSPSPSPDTEPPSTYGSPYGSVY